MLKRNIIPWEDSNVVGYVLRRYFATAAAAAAEGGNNAQTPCRHIKQMRWFILVPLPCTLLIS